MLAWLRVRWAVTVMASPTVVSSNLSDFRIGETVARYNCWFGVPRRRAASRIATANPSQPDPGTTQRHHDTCHIVGSHGTGGAHRRRSNVPTRTGAAARAREKHRRPPRGSPRGPGMGITSAEPRQPTPLPPPTHTRRASRCQANRERAARPAHGTAQRTDPGRTPRTDDRARRDRPRAQEPALTAQR